METWAIVAASVGESLAAFLERAPGADRPRDIEHLKRQSAIVELARQGGWRALPELALDPGPRSRAIDVALVRPTERAAIVVEVWDWLDDVGAAWRGLDAKVLALPQRLEPRGPWTVAGLFVLRHTRRNHALVHELAPLFRARFTVAGSGWIRALGDATVTMPQATGFLWSTADGRLTAPRLRR